jgi:hypothetical protein
MTPKKRTAAVVVAAVLALAVYDLGAYLLYGGAATISSIVGNWSAASLWVAVLLGGLLGHLLGSGDGLDAKDYAIRAGLALGSACVAFAATVTWRTT